MSSIHHNKHNYTNNKALQVLRSGAAKLRIRIRKQPFAIILDFLVALSYTVRRLLYFGNRSHRQ
jgi:hypothetical protein